MAMLGREIRFAINPFLRDGASGANSFCAKPAGEGLAIYFSMWVVLDGAVSSETGFVVNVVEIDRIVRNYAVGIFDSFIREKFNQLEHVSFEDMANLLKMVAKKLIDKFGQAKPAKIELELTPNRKLGVKTEDADMMYFGEKFEFAASHTLWNGSFSDEKNIETFGKCANPAGHGHNYVVEVVVKKTVEGASFEAGQFEKVVAGEFVNLVDHKNLNADIEHFSKVNPTVENIAEFAFKCLDGKFGLAKLDNVTVWESSRTFCSYRRD